MKEQSFYYRLQLFSFITYPRKRNDNNLNVHCFSGANWWTQALIHLCCFLDIGKRAVFECSSRTHSDE